MAITVKKIVLWRKEVDNRPGTLAQTLAPLASAGASLQLVMGFSTSDDAAKAAGLIRKASMARKAEPKKKPASARTKK